MPHPPEKLIDVLGLGCTAVDDVVCVPLSLLPIKRSKSSGAFGGAAA